MSRSQSGSAPLRHRTLPVTRRPSTKNRAPSSTCRPLTIMVRSSSERTGKTCRPRCSCIGPAVQRAGWGWSGPVRGPRRPVKVPTKAPAVALDRSSVRLNDRGSSASRST